MATNKSVERIVRPIVEGQIRGFIKEHPSILTGVNWYKPRKDKALTLTNSLSKRIVRDLACDSVVARLVAAIVEDWSSEQQNSSVAPSSAPKGSWLAKHLAKTFRALFPVKQRETHG